MQTLMQIDLASDDLREIRDAVPQLDLVAIRALNRAGFSIVRSGSVPQPQPTLALQQLPGGRAPSDRWKSFGSRKRSSINGVVLRKPPSFPILLPRHAVGRLQIPLEKL